MKDLTINPSCLIYDAWLGSAAMPPDTTRNIMDLYSSSEEIYNAFFHKDQDLFQMIPSRFREILYNNGTEKKMKTMQSVMEKNGISILRYSDETYPLRLREIEQYPPILFYQGNLHCLQRRSVAMVGSRAASYTGQKAARKLACELSKAGISIVSGMACGIDASSHQGCLEGGSPTIAVTGCGLDIVYPRENTALRDDILSKEGLILTEYAPGEKPAGWHFPFRNRIICGISHALILIEAKIRSGSMTSVQHALDQGKDVFVYPGDPDSEYFEGNHRLLREGGIYFTEAEDVLSDLHWLDNQSSVRQNIDCSPEESVSTPEQAAVIRALKPGTLGFEQLLERTSLDPPVLMSTLTILQISGLIESLPGKQYKIKH